MIFKCTCTYMYMFPLINYISLFASFTQAKTFTSITVPFSCQEMVPPPNPHLQGLGGRQVWAAVDVSFSRI